MAAEHTPTPWAVVYRDDEERLVIVPPAAAKPAWDIAELVLWADHEPNDAARIKANAAFIVRACNRDHVFDELVAALEQIAQIQRDKCEKADAESLFMVLDQKVSIACAALAKAKETQ